MYVYGFGIHFIFCTLHSYNYIIVLDLLYITLMGLKWFRRGRIKGRVQAGKIPPQQFKNNSCKQQRTLRRSRSRGVIGWPLKAIYPI